jgi:hypothetical protein
MAKQTPQTAPWSELGFVKQDVEERAETAILMFEGWSSAPPVSTKQADRWLLVEQWVNNVHRVGWPTFTMGALGYTIEHPVLQDWREAGRQMVAADLYYFFGPWKDKKFVYYGGEVVDPEQARGRLKWINNYRESLMSALSLSDWKSAERLLEWPGPEVKEDQGLDNRTPEDNAYQIWLAMRLRGDSGSEVDARRDLISRRSRQRPKLLALAADALFAGEPKQLAKTLADYLEYYRQREIDLRRDPGERVVFQGICPEGTVLWHLARRRGLGEIKLPKDLMIMIARP